MNVRLATLWTSAAWREAARVRAAEVDVEHLYVGLIVVGGAAAQLLGRHGVTLASARSRAREALSDDRAPLGVDIADLPSPIHFMQLGDTAWQATPRADAVVKAAKMTDTFDLLITLLQEPSGTVRRLVVADGVPPQSLVPELKAGADDPYSPEKVAADATLLPRPNRALRVRRYVSAPADAVAEALADPALLGLWAYDPVRTAELSADGLTVTHVKGGNALTVQLAVTRERQGEARVVTWTHAAVSGGYAGQRLSYDRFEVIPAAGGSGIVRTAGRRTFGVVGLLASPLVDHLVGDGILHTMEAITFGIADRQPN